MGQIIRDYRKLGEITIDVFASGQCPSRVEGLSEPQLLIVYAAHIHKVADEMRKKGADPKVVMVLKKNAEIVSKLGREYMTRVKTDLPAEIKPDIIGEHFPS